jgi:hypothetical protein
MVEGVDHCVFVPPAELPSLLCASFAQLAPITRVPSSAPYRCFVGVVLSYQNSAFPGCERRGSKQNLNVKRTLRTFKSRLAFLRRSTSELCLIIPTRQSLVFPWSSDTSMHNRHLTGSQSTQPCCAFPKQETTGPSTLAHLHRRPRSFDTSKPWR